jgi:hypothetical protein
LFFELNHRLNVQTSGQPPPVLFVTGPEATGKTSIVSTFFRASRLRFAYVPLTTVKHSQRLLLERIIRQLSGNPDVSVENLPQFMHRLRDCFAAPAVRLASLGFRLIRQDMARPCFIVLDGAELLLDMAPTLIQTLTNLATMVRFAALTC